MRTKLAMLATALVTSNAAYGAGITYDCDTAAGHFSELDLPAPAGAFSVTGNIQVNNIAADKKWAPTARVRIASTPPAGGHAPTAYSGFELTAIPGSALKLSANTVQAFSFDTAGKEGDMIASSIQPTGPVQPFSLSYDGRNVTVALGSETRSYPLVAAQPVVQVICSTGEFLITEMTIRP